jgi:hypothetical protein
VPRAWPRSWPRSGEWIKREGPLLDDEHEEHPIGVRRSEPHSGQDCGPVARATFLLFLAPPAGTSGIDVVHEVRVHDDDLPTRCEIRAFEQLSAGEGWKRVAAALSCPMAATLVRVRSTSMPRPRAQTHGATPLKCGEPSKESTVPELHRAGIVSRVHPPTSGQASRGDQGCSCWEEARGETG